MSAKCQEQTSCVPPGLSTGRRGSSRDACDLRALKTQAIHQPFLIQDEADDGACKVVGINGSPAPTVTITIDPSMPTFQPYAFSN
jgi:hypothetical protein